MQIFSIFQRHSWYAANADAFADGELAGPDSSRFQAHLTSCDACQARVAEGRQLRAVIAELPEIPAPRSFRLTPSMVAASKPASVASRAPAGLILVRAGAAVSVVAFASILAFGALDSGDSDSTAGRQASGAFAAEDAAGAPVSESALSDKSAATAEVPRLASPATGGASGSSLATPTAMTSSALVPSTGGAPASQAGDQPSPVANAYEDGGATSSIGPPSDGSTSRESASKGDGGPGALTVVAGVIAVGLVGALAAVEVTRRVRRDSAET